MIEMQYNFPLLPGIGLQWRARLLAAVSALSPENADELRPTFRMERLEQRGIAAKWLGVPVERTWLVSGGHHGVLVSLLAAGLAGKTIAVEAVTYSGIVDQAKLLGAKLVACAFDGEGFVPESLRAVCERELAAGGRVDAMYTMPTVHNPLGYVAGLARREAIAAVAREFDLLIVEDDAYGYMEAEAPASYRELAPERTFFVRGLSKGYAPATQTGFLVAPERFGAAVENAVKNTTTGGSLVHNAAALSLVADGTVDSVMQAKRAEGARRNAAARAVLGDAAAPGARCAWQLWVMLPEGMTAVEAQQVCQERGVLVSGAKGFTPPGVAVARALRIGLGGEVDSERTAEGVRIVAGVVGR